MTQVEQLRRLAKQATNGWACYAKTKREHDDIARLHGEIDAIVDQTDASEIRTLIARFTEYERTSREAYELAKRHRMRTEAHGRDCEAAVLRVVIAELEAALTNGAASVR